jgi:hypothetical protein
LNDNSNEWDFRNRDFSIKFSRIDDNIARIEFVDANGQNIPIPQGVTLTTGGGVQQQPIQNSFYITWVANYTLHERGVILCEISNQKQQSLRGSQMTNGRTYDANGVLLG